MSRSLPSIRRTRLAGLSLICALVLGISACSSSSSSSDSSDQGGLSTVKMVMEWPTADAFWIPWIVARDKGYFEQAGIDLQIIQPPNTSATAQYIGTGRADVAFDTSMDVITARAAGAPMVSVAAYGKTNNWGLLSSSDAPLNFADIKGKTIGTYTDAWSKAQLQIMLKSAGLSLSDVKLVTAANDTVPLLLQHKVDAITGVTNAEGSELASEGHGDYSFTAAKDHGVPDSPVWVVAANSDWLAKNPAIAKAWMAATIKGWRYAIAHPAEAVADFEKDYPKAETTAFATQQWKDTTKLFGTTVNDSAISQSDSLWSGLLKAAQQGGVVKTVTQPGDYYSNSLLGQ